MLRRSTFARLFPIFITIFLIMSLLPVQPVSGQGAVQAPYIGIWISADELASLPTSGAAWDALVNAANAGAGSPDIQNQDSDNDVYILAKALVYARTGDGNYRSQVLAALEQAMGTEDGGRTLALGRNLVSYVIAADLVNLPAANPGLHAAFSSWLRGVMRETLDGKTLVSTHEERPNNWGTHAGASRVAAAWYTGDRTELDRAALVFRGWLGDRSAYAGFSWGDLSWQCDSSAPVGVNPRGCSKNGVNIDGAMPDDMRRGGSFQDPPVFTDYAWEAMQGALVQALILQRAGYPALQWSDSAVLRAVQYLDRIGWKAASDDHWQPWLINYAYGSSYPTSPAGRGKNMGWTDWTHGGRRLGGAQPPISLPPQPTTPPVVSQAYPVKGATVRNDMVVVTVQFSQNMNPATINANTFKVNTSKGTLTGNVSYYAASRTATFTAKNSSSTTVHVELTTGIKDEGGRALTSAQSWSYNLQYTNMFRLRLPIIQR